MLLPKLVLTSCAVWPHPVVYSYHTTYIEDHLRGYSLPHDSIPKSDMGGGVYSQVHAHAVPVQVLSCERDMGVGKVHASIQVHGTCTHTGIVV